MSKAFTKSLSQLNRALIRRLNALVIRAQPPPPGKPDGGRVAATLVDALPVPASGGASVCMVEGGLLRSSSAFPYFMLVALEAGGLLRGLILLLLYPALRLLGHGVAIKAMAVVSFLGLRKDAFRAGRAALPRLLLEDVSAEVFDAAVGRRQQRCVVCVSAMPRAMVEPFLKEYLGVDAVVAPEMRELRGRYLGVMQGESEVVRGLDVELEKVTAIACGAEKGGDGSDVVGVGGLGSSFAHHLFQKHCKVYVPTESARRRWHALPRRRYPKPLIFHDGRIAFRPMPAATLAMFMWLPLGAALAVVRIASFIVLPFSLSVPLLAALGMHSRIIANASAADNNLFACNHRSLLDPLYVAAAAGRADLAAATYSISRLSEVLSLSDPHLPPHPRPRGGPRRHAGEAVPRPRRRRQRRPGGLPRGHDLPRAVPAAVQPALRRARRRRDAGGVALGGGHVPRHDGGGMEGAGPVFPAHEPGAGLRRAVLGHRRLRRRRRPGGGGGPEAARAVANEVQRRIAEALGYTCTGLTRRDKYLMLAGNEGIVDVDHGAKKKPTCTTTYY